MKNLDQIEQEINKELNKKDRKKKKKMKVSGKNVFKLKKTITDKTYNN